MRLVVAATRRFSFMDLFSEPTFVVIPCGFRWQDTGELLSPLPNHEQPPASKCSHGCWLPHGCSVCSFSRWLPVVPSMGMIIPSKWRFSKRELLNRADRRAHLKQWLRQKRNIVDTKQGGKQQIQFHKPFRASRQHSCTLILRS